MGAYDTTTHLGAYLAEINYFCPNGIVAFMQTEVLSGYADASGKYTTLTDTILTVNGCLATTDQWEALDLDWQAYLKAEKFIPDEETGRYVFHTSEFMTGNCEFMPTYLRGGVKHHIGDRERIYWNLFGLIGKHTQYRFGYGVSLPHFRKFEEDFPYAQGTFFKQPGTFVSILCFYWNSMWAQNTGKYNPSISYKFDRGDEFWGELFHEYQSKRRKLKDPCVSDLSDGDKVKFSGIQAADVIAWACRKDYATLSEAHLSGLHKPPKPSRELRRIHVPGKSDLRLYAYKDLEYEVRNRLEEILEQRKVRNRLVGDGTPHPTIDDLARALFAMDKEDAETQKQALRDAWFAKRSAKRGKQ